MTPAFITIVTAAFCAAILLALSVGVSYLRITRKVSLGDGGDYVLNRVGRAHANAAEFIPLSLVLLFLAEVYTTTGSTLLWVGAGMLMLGRALHAWGLVTKRLTKRRQIGALLNYLFIAYMIVLLLIAII